MWIDKVIDGVLELDTPIGPRYVQPNFLQRVYLTWTFRNFFSLPQQVLLPWERHLIDRLWSDNRFVSLSMTGESDGPVIHGLVHYRPIIGRVERRATADAETASLRKPVAGSSHTRAEQGREAASA
jgi:hypothetical protein